MLRLRPPRSPRTILRLEAAFDFVVAAVLLLGPADRLYDLFALPEDTPAALGRALSVPLFLFAGLLWLASIRPALYIPVALFAAIANALTIPLILVWMLTGGSDMDPAGFVISIALALILAAFSSLELEIVRRGEPLTPPPPAGRA